jgi:hypothetical protein
MTRVVSFVALLSLSLPASAEPTKKTKTPPAPRPVPAVASVRCTVRAIHAQHSKKARPDKRLAPLRKQLSKPPFSAYRSFQLLDVKELDIPQAATRQVSLPTGKVLKLTFKERLLGRKNQLRLRMHLSITPPHERQFLPGTLYTIANRGLILVAGDKHLDGTLVVGITCQAR